jgi:hypothetical protein
MLLECAGTRRLHDCHCAAYVPPVDGTLESAHCGSQTTNHYAATLEAAPVRAQDAPRRLGWGRIRQDGRQLRGAARHASTRREIVRHTCKLFPPWPIKGGAVPQAAGTREDGQRSPTRSPPSPQYWHLSQSIPLGRGGQASSPTTLVAPLYEHHGAKQYSAPEHTTAGRTTPAGTRINLVSLVSSTGPSRGKSQRSLLVSVGTTFCTDSWRAR